MLEEVRKGRTLDTIRDRALADLKPADRRLAHELAAGVLRQRSALDAQLAPLVPRGWDAVDAKLQNVLRLGAYQIGALDRVPRHAAVDTSVALAKAHGGTRAAGFVNAVLRRLADSGRSLVDHAPTDLATEFSHPEWLVQRWLDRYGPADTERLLRWNNTRPHLILQPARLDFESLRELWHAAGVEATPAAYGAGLVVASHTRPEELPGFTEGDFVVQDPAQALLAWYADLPPGALVYDACAAPGGKALTAARDARVVITADVNVRRVRRLVDNLHRAGTGREHPVVADARRPPLAGADAVLLDVPCLGTGTFARHPDARWRVTPEALGDLVQLQAELLDSAAAVVRPGGLLVYSTCSLEPEENEQQVAAFLARRTEFTREPNDTLPTTLVSSEGELMILPQRHAMDGAFAARLRRAG